MFPRRPLIALVVAVALALAPVAVAARTVHGPVTDLVICGDGGAQTVRLDTKGNPVDPGQCCDCLDCLTIAVALPLTSGQLPVAPTLLPPQSVPARQILPAAGRHLRPSPRAPPMAAPAGDHMSQARLSLAALEFGQVPRGKAMPKTGQTSRVAR